MTKIAVYGVLKKGFRLYDEVRGFPFKGTGKVEGFKMYSLHNGGYPGIKHGEGIIHVEVYDITNKKQMQKIDWIEGSYDKELVKVNMDDGSEIEANIYVFKFNVKEKLVIEDGIWK